MTKVTDFNFSEHSILGANNIIISELLIFDLDPKSVLLHMSTRVRYSKISTVFVYIALSHSLRYHTGHAGHAHWDTFVHILLTTEIYRFFVSFLQFSLIDYKYMSMYNTMTHLYILICVTFLLSWDFYKYKIIMYIHFDL